MDFDQTAFNASGEREPVIGFDWAAVEENESPSDIAKAQEEAMLKLLRYVTLGDPTAQQLKARVYLLKHYLRPEKTQAELAAELGLSQGRISQLLIEIRSDLAGNPRN